MWRDAILDAKGILFHLLLLLKNDVIVLQVLCHLLSSALSPSHEEALDMLLSEIIQASNNSSDAWIILSVTIQ